MNEFSDALLTWYRRVRRPLPWRENPDPYWIYLSEVMLQQTRMESALPYFDAFIREWPTLEALAQADDERLLKVWEGLGYYSRARNLKRGAAYIVTELGGVLPEDTKELEKIPGIGPYSAGAIASVLYHKPVSAIDGNVFRVFSRLYRLEEELPSAALTKAVRERVLPLIPEEAPGDFNQALMELGALICKPTSPACPTCPLRAFCQSADREDAASFPRRKKKKAPTKERHTVMILESAGEFALMKKNRGLLQGLYSFPMREGHLDADALLLALETESYQVKTLSFEGEATHIFSHRIWDLLVYRILLYEKVEGYEWVEKERLQQLPIASAFQRAKEILGL